jgi:tRNA 2-selenouridine synthase
VPIPVLDFLKQAKTLPLIDVRSPGEFGHAHIPGAVNIPLFDDAERAQVGTRYKQAGKDLAVLMGLEMVGPKLADFVRQARKLTQISNGQVLVHCWRGGMRSGSFAWLLQTAGMYPNTLEGGYKAYRNTVLTALAEPRKLLILGGKTGSGKTDILRHLRQQGEQVICLESLAHHKGSSYGAIGQLPQPSSEQFENLIFREWAGLNPNKRIWLEDESRNVGACFVPMPLWLQMRAAPVAFVDIPKSLRISRLVQEYTGIDHQLLIEATKRIEKRLGGKVLKDCIAALTVGDYATVADLTLDYYDRAYLHGLSQRNPAQVFKLDIAEDNPATTAQTLVAWADGIG